MSEGKLLTLNRERCVFNIINISLFGYVWNPEGIPADPKMVEEIRKMKTPDVRLPVASGYQYISHVYLRKVK